MGEKVFSPREGILDCIYGVKLKVRMRVRVGGNCDWVLLKDNKRITMNCFETFAFRVGQPDLGGALPNYVG